MSLHGVNFVGYELGVFTKHEEEDYARIKSWGLNLVRLPIAWQYLEPEPNVYNSSYLDYVERDLSWARKYGIYIILDFHQWHWSPHFNFEGRACGLPVWAVSKYPNTMEGMGRAITDFWLGKGPNGSVASEENPSLQNRFVHMWRLVASRFKNDPCVAAYDLFNEPYRSDNLYEGGLTPFQTAEYLYPLYYTLIGAIREVDARHVIIYEPVGGWDVPSVRMLLYGNIALSFHCYDYHSTYDGNTTKLEDNFEKKFLLSPSPNPISDWDLPIYLGEFGTCLEYPNSSSWLVDMLTIFSSHQLLYWTFWAYFRCDDSYSLLHYNGTEKVEFVSPLKAATSKTSTNS